MSEQHLITVVVRTKDRPDRLQEALDSIAAQTHPHIEVVVVNDGGACVEGLVGTWQHQTQRPVQYVALPHSQGRAAALNQGFQSATGTWLAILDDDDVYRPSGLRLLLQQALCRQLDVVYGIVDLVDHKGTETILRKKFQTPYSRHRFLFENYIPVNAILFKKSLLNAVGLVDVQFHIFEDWDFLFRLSLITDFGFVEDVVAEYRNFGTATGAGANEVILHKNARQQFYSKHWSSLNPIYLSDFYDLVHQDAESKYLEIVHRTDQHIQNNELHFSNFFTTLQAIAKRLDGQDKNGNEFLNHFSNLFNIADAIAKRIDFLEKRNNEFEQHFSNLFDNTHALMRDHYSSERKIIDLSTMINSLSEKTVFDLSKMIDSLSEKIDRLEIENKFLKMNINAIDAKNKENHDLMLEKIQQQIHLLTLIIEQSLMRRIKNQIKRFFKAIIG